MKIQVFKKSEDLYATAADLITNEITSKPHFVLGLAAGNTPKPLYQKIVELYEQRTLSFSHVKTFNLDEYVGIDQEHVASFYRFTQELLFDPTDINQLETYGLNGVAQDLKIECEHYENNIKASGPIDTQILGIGSNGHIGFNEPGSAKTSRTRLVTLSAETKFKIPKDLFAHEEIPSQGLTMGIANILEAKKIILIATGESKATAVENCFTGVESASWPASFLQSHPNFYVYLDASAAQNLKGLPVPS